MNSLDRAIALYREDKKEDRKNKGVEIPCEWSEDNE